MLVPKKNRKIVFSYLFREGVIVCKKALSMTKHNELEVPNIHVVKLMQSLKSKGFVTEKFNWQWLYFTLTNEGIEYLREFLHVSAETVPDTIKRAKGPEPRENDYRPPRDFDQDRPRRGGDREGYRGPKDDSAPRNFRPEFAGRGRGGGGNFGRGGRGRGGFGGGGDNEQ
eukprot:gb/GEZN01010599.1/.p1 GENE.gb/GEZN01010599.1/~~gb/GEZN01010599.1/.p1  ORF type:complete len:170 (-),score=24.59 gb/GEZN01010599.1/:349-858(-)